MNWQQIDEFIASLARPFTVYASVTTLCFCVLFLADTRVIVIPILGTLAGGVAVLRTVDKKTNANAATAVNVVPNTEGKAG